MAHYIRSEYHIKLSEKHIKKSFIKKSTNFFLFQISIKFHLLPHKNKTLTHRMVKSPQKSQITTHSILFHKYLFFNSKAFSFISFYSDLDVRVLVLLETLGMSRSDRFWFEFQPLIEVICLSLKDVQYFCELPSFFRPSLSDRFRFSLSYL